MSETDEQQEQQDKEEHLEEIDAPPAIKELAKAKLSKAWMVRRELKKLPEMLSEDEQVINLARGEYDSREGLMAVTDRRVLFLEQGVMRHRFEDFRFDKITSVQQSTGPLAGKLTIFSAGNKHVIAGIHPKHRTVEIADYVRSRTAEASAAAAPAPASETAPKSGEDVMEQLRKLGELRDAGVLTEEEFEAKKADLLARM